MPVKAKINTTKPVVIEKEVYRISELPEEIQDEIIEKYSNITIDYGWWDYILEDLKIQLEKLGVEYSDAYFNLDRKPYLKIVDVYLDLDLLYKKWIEEQGIENEEIHKLIKSGDIYFEYEILTTRRSIGVGYSEFPIWMEPIQTESDALRLYITAPDDFDERKLDNFEKSFTSWIISAITDILWDYYKKLNKEYDYITSKEGIIDFLDANEYYFDKEGNNVDIVEIIDG